MLASVLVLRPLHIVLRQLHEPLVPVRIILHQLKSGNGNEEEHGDSIYTPAAATHQTNELVEEEDGLLQGHSLAEPKDAELVGADVSQLDDEDP